MHNLAQTIPPAPAPAQIEELLRARLASGSLELPLLPQVASQVLALADDPDADANQLAALIFKDPALAGKVLRVANSAASASRVRIVSLQQAVARLGTASVSEIAFVASMQSGIFKVRGHDALLRELWQEAIGAGLYAREIARVQRSNVESAYLCGLLHAAGKPLVLQLAVDASAKLGITLTRADLQQLFAALYVECGLLLGETWKLSAVVLSAIANHAAPLQAKTYRTEALVTALAGAFARHALLEPPAPAGGPAEEALRAPPWAAALNLYPEDVDLLIARASAVCALVQTQTS